MILEIGIWNLGFGVQGFRRRSVSSVSLKQHVRNNLGAIWVMLGTCRRDFGGLLRDTYCLWHALLNALPTASDTEYIRFVDDYPKYACSKYYVINRSGVKTASYSYTEVVIDYIVLRSNTDNSPQVFWIYRLYYSRSCVTGYPCRPP